MTKKIDEYNVFIASPGDEDFNDEIFSKYKQFALGEHRHLPLKGFVTSLRANIEIAQVYVTMRANIQFCDFDLTLEGKRKVKERIAKEQLSDLDIKATFQAAQKQHIKDIVILGDPGSGKTTLLKYILVMLIEGKGAEKLGIDNDLIPFFAPLRELKDPDRENFTDFICRVCCVEKHKVAQKRKEGREKRGTVGANVQVPHLSFFFILVAACPG